MKKTIEQKLRNLFDYQQFENNPELLEMKKQSELRFRESLSEEDLVFVNAAGEQNRRIIINPDDPKFID